MQTRWAGNRELRGWFKGLPTQERVEWYIKQQQNDTGKKRSRDDMNFIDTYSNNALLRESELDECIPWRIYRRRAISDGEEATQAAYNFISLIQNNRVDCRFHRGEWHVPEYQGLRIETGKEITQGHTVTRSGAVVSAAELLDRIADGEGMLKKQVETLQSHANQGQAALRTDTPSINVSLVSQPTIVPHCSIVMAELNRGVIHTRTRTHTHTHTHKHTTTHTHTYDTNNHDTTI
jgi:hypothetical protein